MDWITYLAGLLGLSFLVCFSIWFFSHPISRDKVLVSFDRKYFILVGLVMISCTLFIAGLIAMHLHEGAQNSTSENIADRPFFYALQYCLKMKEAKDGSLNILTFMFIMLFQVVVFEGMVLAAIVGWSNRRIEKSQNGQIRYSIKDLTRPFVSQWDDSANFKWYKKWWLRYKPSFLKNVIKNEFAVVIGANEVAPSVIKNLLKSEDQRQSLNYAHERTNQYVVLQTCSEIGEVRKTLQSYLTKDEYNRVIIYSDLRNSYEGLKTLHLAEASEIYVLGENTTFYEGETFHDTMNMRCVNMIAKVLGDRKDDLKVCKVLFEYQTTYSVFQFSDVTEEVKRSVHFIPFNRYESWARRVMVDNKALALIDENDKEISDATEREKNTIYYTPLDDYKGIKYDDDKRVHFIVVGMSKMGVAMGTQALFQAHYPNYVRDHSLKSRITFIDANAYQEMQFFKGRYATLFELARHRYVDMNNDNKEKGYPWIDPMVGIDYKWGHLSEKGKNFLDVEIEFVKGELESEGVREYLRQATADETSKVTIAICLPQTHQAVAAALYMPNEVYKNVQEIWVYQREASDIVANLTHEKADNHYRKLKPFGMVYGEYIDSRTYYLKALIVNRLYYLRRNTASIADLDMGIKEAYKDLRTKWNELTVELKWSNKYFSDLIYQKIRSIMPYESDEIARGGYENEMFNQPDWYMRIEKALENAPGLAECEHNRWNVQQLLLGFIPADKEIDEKVQNIKGKLTEEQLSKYKKNLKSPAYKVHYCICDFNHMDKVDNGAKDYDVMLNNGIPFILAHVDGYRMKIWEMLKRK